MNRFPFDLIGKKALVTGGGSGIGAATCKELAQAGASVYVADINLESARAVARDIDGIAVELDVTDIESVRTSCSDISSLDILVNNAGIGHVGKIADVTSDDFDRVMRVNAYSVFNVTRYSYLYFFRPVVASSI